jgi:hypothetical protein
MLFLSCFEMHLVYDASGDDVKLSYGPLVAGLRLADHSKTLTDLLKGLQVEVV